MKSDKISAPTADQTERAQAIAAAFSRGHDAGWQACSAHIAANAPAPSAPELEKARWEGVQSVQIQVAAIVLAALELLEAAGDNFPPEKLVAFRRVFGAAQPVQQPGAEPEPITVEAVAEVRSGDDGLYLDWLIEGGICALVEGCVLVMPSQPITDDEGSGEVYLAAPAQRQPLSDEQINAIGWARHGGADPQEWFRNAARAIEAAHGITAAPAAQKGEKL